MIEGYERQRDLEDLPALLQVLHRDILCKLRMPGEVVARGKVVLPERLGKLIAPGERPGVQDQPAAERVRPELAVAHQDMPAPEVHRDGAEGLSHAVAADLSGDESRWHLGRSHLDDIHILLVNALLLQKLVDKDAVRGEAVRDGEGRPFDLLVRAADDDVSVPVAERHEGERQPLLLGLYRGLDKNRRPVNPSGRKRVEELRPGAVAHELYFVILLRIGIHPLRGREERHRVGNRDVGDLYNLLLLTGLRLRRRLGIRILRRCRSILPASGHKGTRAYHCSYC